jgi:hypothetical protein
MNRWSLTVAFLIVMLIVFWFRGWFGVFGWGPANWYPTSVTGVVKEKYIKDNLYCVTIKTNKSEEIEVLTCRDTHFPLMWNTDSSDDFANLELGAQYQFSVGGYRSTLRSLYRNIIRYQRQ